MNKQNPKLVGKKAITKFIVEISEVEAKKKKKWRTSHCGSEG